MTILNINRNFDAVFNKNSYLYRSNMKKVNPILLINIFFFIAGLIISAYLTLRDGFKTGPWLITLGFLFLILMIRENRKNNKS